MERHKYTFEGISPETHTEASVSVESTLIGDVTVAANATVWPGAVLRGDVDAVRVGEESAVGDNAVLHGTRLEAAAMVGHSAVLNGSYIGEEVMVGANATVSEARIGERSLVAMGTVVPEGYEVPPDSFVRGMPARVTPLSEVDVDRDAVYEQYASDEYGHLVDGHEDLF